MKLVFATLLQNELKTRWVRVLLTTFKPVNNLICCRTGLMRVVKQAASLFNIFGTMLQDKLYVARFSVP